MRRTLVPALTALLCLSLAGCKVTEGDVDYWTGTQKGPGKIVAVLLADKYEDQLRSYAGLALVRMEPRPATDTQNPVDGVSELQAAVRQLPEETRTRLVDLMVPDLIRMMRGEDAPAAEGDENTVPRRQVRAKDAAFLLVPYVSSAKRQELTDAVVDWFTVDFNGRSLEGTYTAEQVIRQLGAPAASRLVSAMSAQLPQQALVKVAELISTLGDDPTKQRAASRLVEIEREMESDEFTNSLKERLREQFHQNHPDQEVEEARIDAAAVLNRENFITLGALPAMKHLNHERVVQDRLLEIAQLSGTDEPTATRRQKALQAMEGGVRPDQCDALVDIALNDATPTAVRDYSFDRIADARATSAIPRLWPVFADTPDWRLRWRVGSLILTLGGDDVLDEFFQKLNDEEYAREELYNYGERISQMRPPPTDFINRQLRSSRWFDRIIALYFYEKRATAEDVPRITALAHDSAATHGQHWEDQDTVGKVAEAVAHTVQERLAQAQGNAGGGTEGFRRLRRRRLGVGDGAGLRRTHEPRPEQEDSPAVPVPGLPVGDLRADERRAGVLGRLPDQRGDAAVRALPQLRSAHAGADAQSAAVDPLCAPAAAIARSAAELPQLVRCTAPEQRGLPASASAAPGAGLVRRARRLRASTLGAFLVPAAAADPASAGLSRRRPPSARLRTAASVRRLRRAGQRAAAPAQRRRGRRPDGPALRHLQRPEVPGRQGRVHHRPRNEDGRPAHQGRQHLPPPRRGDLAKRRLVHEGPRLHQWRRVPGAKSRHEAHRRRRCLPTL